MGDLPTFLISAGVNLERDGKILVLERAAGVDEGPAIALEALHDESLAAEEPRAEALGLQAHEPVADAGERRQHDAVLDRHASKCPGVGERGHGQRNNRSGAVRAGALAHYGSAAGVA